MTLKKNIYPVTALALVVVFFLSACVPQTAVPAPSATATPALPVRAALKILNVLHPESPTILNLHLTNSVKDWEPARIVYEPLAAFNKDGELVPILAAEKPSLENGELAKDGKSVTWKLRQDIRWSDGEPFTADDVAFTYSYVADPDVKANTFSNYYSQIASVEALDDFTVKIVFKDVNPAWAVPFVGNRGVILPRHIFEAYKGKNAREAPANTMPVGTGPYRVMEPGIKPQEVLLLGSQIVQTTKIVFEPNPYYRFPDKIFFDRIVWRGGGTANEAARQSLQEGNMNVADLAYNLDSVDPTELSKLLENSNKGKPLSAFGAGVIRIQLNRTDPNRPSAEGEYSSLDVKHPFFSDKKVRQALAYAINRDAIAALFGANGLPTYVNLVAPPQYRSTSSDFYKYDLKEANRLLDEAGYMDANGDGVRENKDGVKMKFVFQCEVNSILQQAQELIQKDLKAIGIDTELKIRDPNIMFGSSANPDSVYHFNADMMMFRTRSSSPDPSGYMAKWICKSIPQKYNNWTGDNYERWCNPEYDALLQQAKIELDPVKRANMFIQLNDMLVEDVVMIPVVWSASELGVNQKLTGLDPTPWDSITWNIQDWRFTGQ